LATHTVTGIGPDGRSTVLATQDKATSAAPGFAGLADDSAIEARADRTDKSILKLYEADRPGVVDRPAAGELLPIATPPLGALWLEMKFDGPYETEFHRTDSIDFHYIVAGEVELMLEDGSVTLRAGDSVVVPGVIHRWRSELSWHSSLFVIGLDPA
jgi:mannose-6-phosphate isomerase-like protein (cupin superfamily)